MTLGMLNISICQIYKFIDVFFLDLQYVARLNNGNHLSVHKNENLSCAKI